MHTSDHTQNNIRVLGIDPGYERLGVAIVEKNGSQKETLCMSDCFRTPNTLTFHERLNILGQSIIKLFETYHPTHIALETLFITNNQKTGTHVAEVRGMLLYLSAKHHIHVLEYAPLQVKSTITGYGKATKSDMMRMIPLLIPLPQKPMLDDEYDAIAVALTAIAHNPQKH
jgi:crossover junction endodeoxyribonuclease RuvC